MKKGIFDPSGGSSADEGFWPSDARTVQALLCTALLTALFFSWLWQAFRLYSYPGLVPYKGMSSLSWEVRAYGAGL